MFIFLNSVKGQKRTNMECKDCRILGLTTQTLFLFEKSYLLFNIRGLRPRINHYSFCIAEFFHTILIISLHICGFYTWPSYRTKTIVKACDRQFYLILTCFSHRFLHCLEVLQSLERKYKETPFLQFCIFSKANQPFII